MLLATRRNKLSLSLSGMIPKPSTAASTFPNWAAVLAADPLLPGGLREGYHRTLNAFLDFCGQKGLAVTAPAARQFVELARLEGAPSPGRLQQWKDALNWYFQRRRESRRGVWSDVPPLARSDLGNAAWEAALIGYLRQRRRSWRTEQTYRGWMWRFVRFLGSRPIGEVTGAEVRAFLTKLAVEEHVGAATQRQALNALVVQAG